MSITLLNSFRWNVSICFSRVSSAQSSELYRNTLAEYAKNVTNFK